MSYLPILGGGGKHVLGEIQEFIKVELFNSHPSADVNMPSGIQGELRAAVIYGTCQTLTESDLPTLKYLPLPGMFFCFLSIRQFPSFSC